MKSISANKNEKLDLIILDNQNNAPIKIHAEDNSRIHLYIISSKSSEIKVELENAVELEINFASLSQKNGEHEIEVVCRGNNSKVTINAIFLVKTNEHQDVKISNIFEGQNNQGSIIMHGIVEEKARCNLEGRVVIKKTATKTNSQLQEKVLLLGEKSVCNAKPILHIDTNDVKAGHGASMHRLSNEDLFYMQSRGIEKKEAEKLIKQGLLLSPFAHLKKDHTFLKKLELNS